MKKENVYKFNLQKQKELDEKVERWELELNEVMKESIIDDKLPLFICLMENLAEGRNMRTVDLIQKLLKSKNVFDIVSKEEVKRASMGCLLRGSFMSV